MKRRKTLVILLSITLILSVIYGSYLTLYEKDQTTFGNQLLVRGKVGGDVYELQGRLKFLGYYKGKIDGIFGWQTYRSVRNFQYRFGMKVDGVVGPSTKARLTAATKKWKSSQQSTTVKSYSSSPFSNNDIKLMANAVYGESRGESYIGQVAVAAVILNRVRNAAFPNTPSGVIFEPGAFTAVADGQIWLTPNEQAKKAVRDAMSGWDPSNGAIYYFNPNTATSAWIWSRPQIKKIGKHIFCR